MGDVEISLAFGGFVVTDKIGETVGQHAGADCRVKWELLELLGSILCEGTNSGEHDHQNGQTAFKQLIHAYSYEVNYIDFQKIKPCKRVGSLFYLTQLDAKIAKK